MAGHVATACSKRLSNPVTVAAATSNNPAAPSCQRGSGHEWGARFFSLPPGWLNPTMRGSEAVEMRDTDQETKPLRKLPLNHAAAHLWSLFLGGLKPDEHGFTRFGGMSMSSILQRLFPVAAIGLRALGMLSSDWFALLQRWLLLSSDVLLASIPSSASLRLASLPCSLICPCVLRIPAPSPFL